MTNTKKFRIIKFKSKPILTAKSVSKSFNERIVGITGESKKIKALAKSWGIHSKKVSSQVENYLIDHTGLVILLDQNGNFSSTIDYKDDFESSLKAIKSIL